MGEVTAVMSILVAAAVLCPSLHSASAQVVDAGNIKHHRRQLSQQQQQQQQQQGSAPTTPTSSADCGGPYMLCGLSIPKGITCPQGPGYCQKGFYCGESKLSPGSQCLPVPADCGQVGKACCPSNTLSPNTKEADALKPAFCKDGAVCFYYERSAPPKDFYQGQAGNFPCLVVPADCGTGAGKPCCPNQYRISTNPAIDYKGVCGSFAGGLYCDYNDPDNAQRAWHERRGTCVANPPDCGTVGQPCCIQTTAKFEARECKTTGPVGRRLYCDLGNTNTCKLCPTNPTPENSSWDCRRP